MSVFQRQTHLTAGTVIDAENLPHVAVCRTSGVFLSQLRDGFRMCPCQLLHQALPAVLALVYGDEAGHTPDHTGKVGVYIALPRLVDDVKHLDVALTAILFVQLVCRFDAVDFPGCPDAVIGKFHTGIRRDPPFLWSYGSFAYSFSLIYKNAVRSYPRTAFGKGFVWFLLICPRHP